MAVGREGPGQTVASLQPAAETVQIAAYLVGLEGPGQTVASLQPAAETVQLAAYLEAPMSVAQESRQA